MILSSAVQAFICAEPVDMRKSIDGLAALVAPLLGMDALSGQVFVFVVELAAWIEGIDTTRARTVSPVKATLVG